MVDYFGKLKEALNFTLKYKFLWILGFILLLCNMQFSYNYNFGRHRQSNFRANRDAEFLQNESGFSKMFDKFDELDPSHLSSNEKLILVAVVLPIIVILSVIGWYLTSIARGALMKSVEWDQRGESLGFKRAWKFGVSKAFKYMWLSFLLFLIQLPLTLPFIIIFYAVYTTGNGALFCFAYCFQFFIMLGILYLGLVGLIAQRYMVLRDLSPWQSIQAGFRLANKTIVDYFVGSLVLLIPGFVIMLVLFVIFVIPGFIWLFMLIDAAINSDGITLFLVVLFGGGIFFKFLFSFIMAPAMVFMETYWTKVTMELMDKKDPIIEANK